MVDKPRLLFVVTEDWYFVSHRAKLAAAAAAAGFNVAVATRVRDAADAIRSLGIELIPLQHLRRSSINPANEWGCIAELTKVYRSFRPTLVHHVAAKPVVYGGIAARRAGVPAVVNALAGLGFVYSSGSLRARCLRLIALAGFRVALRQPHGRLIVQNRDDEAAVRAERLIDPGEIRLVEGSGVDVAKFAPTDETHGPITAMLAARMLWDKGVGEFVEAARLLRAEGSDIRFVLVGDADGENPSAIPSEMLNRWKREGAVEWWGHRTDMASVLRQAHIVCLPSYREGLPKVLLEAAACGRALIASDVPGCREIVQHGRSGLLVPVRNARALADAVAVLAVDSTLREQMGRNARELACSRYTTEHVNAATLAIYRELLEEVGSAHTGRAASA